MDPAGRVVAFSGRIFGEAAKDEKNAKYLNSPETPLFDKGRILYGYHKAKQFIRKYDFSILVEGQMDIVMSHQAGYTNTVAVSGTGLTSDHLALLHRLSKRLVMAFDADAAGVASSGRAAALALKRGMDVKVVQVPLGKDPADCIQENVTAWKEAVKQAVHVVDFYLNTVMKDHKAGSGDERQLILAVRDTVLPFVARMQHGVDQALFVRNIANTLNLAEEAVWQDVRTAQAALARDGYTPATPTQQTATPTAQKTTPPTRTQELERALAGFLYYQESCEPHILEEKHLHTKAEELGVPLPPILARYTEEREALAFQAEVTHADTEDSKKILDTLLTELAREYRTAERDALVQAVREAERTHDDEKAETLLKKLNKVSQLIERLAG
jgi:DNA primase